ncbi:MAG: hypothetical protein E6G54_06880 [Actinobacteria bacterium]|nr:MAG: hypothetical protein E6G54_06880 [Actinomycetota bacterium]
MSLTTARTRATPKTATPSSTSSANRNSAFVRQGPAALAIGASGWVSSTTAGPPTPERKRSGSLTDSVPSNSLVIGTPRSASLIESFSPGSCVPILLVAVEYRIVPSGEYRVTESKSLGSITIDWIWAVSWLARSAEAGPVRSSGVNASVSELSVIVCAWWTI